MIVRKGVAFDEDSSIAIKTRKIKEMIETYSDAHSLKTYLIDLYVLKQDYRSALDYIYNNNYECKLYEIVINAFENCNYEIAIEAIQHITSYIENTNLITLLGASYYYLNKYEYALEILLNGPIRKRKIDDEIAKYRYVLGLTYEALNKNKDALKQYNKIFVYNEKFEDIAQRIQKLS